jgi:hypothetical protein
MLNGSVNGLGIAWREPDSEQRAFGLPLGKFGPSHFVFHILLTKILDG